MLHMYLQHGQDDLVDTYVKYLVLSDTLLMYDDFLVLIDVECMV